MSGVLIRLKQSEVKFEGQGGTSQITVARKNVDEVVGATSGEDFLVVH